MVERGPENNASVSEMVDRELEREGERERERKRELRIRANPRL